MENQVEQLLETAKAAYQAGDMDKALASTYEAGGALYREMETMKREARAAREGKQ